MKRELQTPLLTRDIGLGGLIRNATNALGIKPCGGCKKREKALDNLLVFVKGKKDASRRV